MHLSNHSQIGNLLSAARGGEIEPLGCLLHAYSNYLRLLAQTHLDKKLQGRVSPSDVVQETLFEAHRDFAAFRGDTGGEFTAWLRQILVNNLARVVERHVLAAKRDVRREVSLERINQSIDHSATRLESVLVARSSSASDHVVRDEHLVALSDAIAELSEDHRRVILLRHIEGLPFEEISVEFGRTCGAVRMLWLRAIEQLRKRLDQGATE